MAGSVDAEQSEIEALRSRVAELETTAAAAAADVRYLEALHRVRSRATEAEDLQSLLESVLDELLDLFACNRAWLLYPCDPDAPSWRVPMERTGAEWPGAFALGVEVPMDEGASAVFAESLQESAPLPYDRTTERSVPEEHVRAFAIQSQIVLALHPHHDKPWLLGLHHCGTDHVWSADEERTFAGIGQQIADALASMLLLRDLRSTEQQVMRLQKMDAIGSLAGGVAHDFNNQLLVMLCYADMIRDVSGLPDGVAAHAESVLEAGERAADLTRELLAFSRRSVLEPRVVDLCSLVRSHESFLRRAVGPGVIIETGGAEAGLSSRVDPHQVEQVLVNLVTNARDALPRGGTVRLEVAARRFADNDGARPHELPAGDYVELSVRDDGVGMDAATAARVFEPFFTTKDQGKGTGLGLSTAYGVVRQSGGTIAVESVRGQGTTFRVLLPRSAATDDTAPRGAASAAGLPGGNESILVVEPHGGVAQVCARVLRSGGYRVITVESPADALARMDEGDRSFDLLISDVVMRGMDGLELAEAALKRQPGIKISFSTGYSSDAIERLRQAGSANRILQKPYLPARLLEHVRDALDS